MGCQRAAGTLWTVSAENGRACRGGGEHRAAVSVRQALQTLPRERPQGSSRGGRRKAQEPRKPRQSVCVGVSRSESGCCGLGTLPGAGGWRCGPEARPRERDGRGQPCPGRLPPAGTERGSLAAAPGAGNGGGRPGPGRLPTARPAGREAARSRPGPRPGPPPPALGPPRAAPGPGGQSASRTRYLRIMRRLLGLRGPAGPAAPRRRLRNRRHLPRPPAERRRGPGLRPRPPPAPPPRRRSLGRGKARLPGGGRPAPVPPGAAAGKRERGCPGGGSVGSCRATEREAGLALTAQGEGAQQETGAAARARDEIQALGQDGPCAHLAAAPGRGDGGSQGGSDLATAPARPRWLPGCSSGDPAAAPGPAAGPGERGAGSAPPAGPAWRTRCCHVWGFLLVCLGFWFFNQEFLRHKASFAFLHLKG